MKGKKIKIWVVAIIFSGCELLPQSEVNKRSDNEQFRQPICIWQESAGKPEKDCAIEYWIRFWTNVETLSWLERKAKIDLLSDHDTEMLQKILLSQGKGTPYQNRLRAQIWAETLMPKMSSEMRKFISVALYQPSLELLEMESALVTLSKANSRYEQSLEKQKQQIANQAGQIEQLLNIEKSIIQSNKNDLNEQKDN
jgi:hypothetical protein